MMLPFSAYPSSCSTTGRCLLAIAFCLLASWLKGYTTDSTAWRYRVEMQGTASSGSTPLWLNANKHGLSSLSSTNAYVRASLTKPFSSDKDRKWDWGFCADVVTASRFTSDFILQQAYVEGKWLHGCLTVGSREYPLELKNNFLSSGSQTLGINARPIPQVRLHLPQYWTLPFTRGWVHLKGHIAFGRFTDDHWQHDFTHKSHSYTDDVLYHSKAGYLKIGKSESSPFSAELGLEMGTQFGGKSYVYDSQGQLTVFRNKVGVGSFLNALFMRGSDVYEQQYKNMEGNHLGSWLIRLNYDRQRWGISLYADHFFEDHSALYFLGKSGYGTGSEWNKRKGGEMFRYHLKDIMLGTEVTLRDCPWLHSIVLEYMYTKYQSGPVYHEHGPQISDQISGLDNYYNHYLYPGWQHWGQVLGNPLYRSPLYNENGDISVANNRFMAFHLGVGGSLATSLHYRLLASYQQALGTYAQPFLAPQNNFYGLAEAAYDCRGRWQGWHIKLGWGLDAGPTLGNQTGWQVTLTKTGCFSHK